MPKKKISQQDFLDLMDEQESTEKVTFARKPAAKKATPKKAKVAAKAPVILAGVKLTPLQEEWLKFAKARTPQFVLDLASAPITQSLIKRIQDKFPILRG